MKKLTGLLFIIGSVLVNIPYMMLISNFEYPDILREPAGKVLEEFHKGGNGLIYTWLAFALTGIPLLFAVIMLGKQYVEKSPTLVKIATTFGIIGFVTQLIGLLRWVFVVPVISDSYNASGASEATKSASVVAFKVVNQFGGVLLGEYIGQLFTIGWMVIMSVVILKSGIFGKWLAYLGFVASGVYILAQTELYHTVIPSFPEIEIAGFAGSVLWIVWMIALGAVLLKKEKAVKA